MEGGGGREKAAQWEDKADRSPGLRSQFSQRGMHTHRGCIWDQCVTYVISLCPHMTPLWIQLPHFADEKNPRFPEVPLFKVIQLVSGILGPNLGPMVFKACALASRARLSPNQEI